MSHPAVLNRRRRTWIASLISTIVTLPLAFFTFVISVISSVACQACSAAENHHFAETFNPGSIVFRCGLVLAFVMTLASWVCTRTRPAAAILLAVAAPATVVLACMLFSAIVDWP
ncbi:hypothetical protein OHA46_13330 [Streptomyces sp. NBC_00708]